jgi:hypothetical protein
MKAKLTNIFLCLVIFLCITKSAYAQLSASATGHIFAEIIPVFSVSETSQMNFGRFSPGPQGGEVILTPASTISVLGSVFTGTGVHNAASFYISGDVDAAFSVTLPPGPIILTHTATAKTMLVEDWVSSPPSGVGTGMLKNGSTVVYVGATLKVGTLTDNPVGSYAGSFTITFDFN